MAKLLNKVPIAGSVVKYGGLELVAERSTGRRNRIGTVVVSAIADAEPGGGEHGDQDRADEEQRTEIATRMAVDSGVKS